MVGAVLLFVRVGRMIAGLLLHLGLAFFFLHTRIDGREHYEVDSVLPL
jgi:hypothetical protein